MLSILCYEHFLGWKIVLKVKKLHLDICVWGCFFQWVTKKPWILQQGLPQSYVISHLRMCMFKWCLQAKHTHNSYLSHNLGHICCDVTQGATSYIYIYCVCVCSIVICRKVALLLQSNTCSCPWAVEGHVHVVGMGSAYVQFSWWSIFSWPN